MSSLKMLSLPLLPQEQIIGMLDIPDLLRFANLSPKCADLVGVTNTTTRLRFVIYLKQKCVQIAFKGFNLVVNEKNYDGEEGIEWNGLGGLKFFESPAVGKGLDFAEGPTDGELSDPGEDSNSEESDLESDGDSDAEEPDEKQGADQDSDEVGDEEIEDEEVGDEEEEEIEDEDVADEDSGEEPNAGDAVPAARIDEDEDEWFCKVSSSTNQSVYQTADLLITHFFHLFPSAHLAQMALWPTNASKKLIEKYEQLRTCERLSVIDFWTDCISRPLSRRLMDWSIDAVVASKESNYHSYVRGDFKYERGFKSERVHVEFGRWVHPNAILNSETVSFEFHRYLPSSASLNAILKGWLSNEKMPNLRRIEWWTDKAENLTGAFRKRVMDGIPEATLTEDERKKVNSEVQDGFLKFIRRGDGRLAEIFACGDVLSIIVY